MTEQEVTRLLESKLQQNKYTLKTLIFACISAFAIGAMFGIYVTKIHWPTLNTEIKTVKEKADTIYLKGDTVTDTKFQYVPGQTVYLPSPASNTNLVAPVSKDTHGAVATKLDGKFDIGKPEFVYQVNGKVGKFNKTDDEKYIFDKGMVDLKQTSTINIQAEIPTIDLTRHNVVTIGVTHTDGKLSPAMGYTGSLGKVGAYQITGSKDSQYIGIGGKF